MARVLVVEDEVVIAMLIEDWLGELGHEAVGPAASVAEGLKLLEAGGIDAALLDVNLGTERSDPIAEALAARKIPFAVMTGGMSDTLDPRFAAQPTLLKPFRFEAVGTVMDTLLNGT